MQLQPTYAARRRSTCSIELAQRVAACDAAGFERARLPSIPASASGRRSSTISRSWPSSTSIGPRAAGGARRLAQELHRRGCAGDAPPQPSACRVRWPRRWPALPRGVARAAGPRCGGDATGACGFGRPCERRSAPSADAPSDDDHPWCKRDCRRSTSHVSAIPDARGPPERESHGTKTVRHRRHPRHGQPAADDRGDGAAAGHGGRPPLHPRRPSPPGRDRQGHPAVRLHAGAGADRRASSRWAWT